MALEPDGANIQNDMKEENCTQSLYIMDDQQKIYLLQNDDDVSFKVSEVFDFS